MDDDGFIKMIPTERLQRMRLPGCPEATIWPRCVLPGEPFHEIYCAYREKAVFDAIQLLNTFKIEKQFALRVRVQVCMLAVSFMLMPYYP